MQRIQSIDIFRGLTIFVMVFVNDLAGVSGLPAWMYHVPPDADAMTFVDIVFPAFLIIVGMSIPLAMNRRLEQGDSFLGITKHIFIRFAGLIVLGVFMVNAGEMNVEANLIPRSYWNVLMYLSAILIWNQYPGNTGKTKYLYFGLQVLGIIVLLILAFLYRKGEPGALSGMTPSWWGILGLIGWAYLIATLIYLVLKDNLAATVGVFGLFVAITLGLKNPDLPLPVMLEWLKGQSGHVVHTSLVLAGIIMTLIVQRKYQQGKSASPLNWILVLGAGCYIAGFFIRPFYGISKIYATPAWALYSITACCMVYALIHWIVAFGGYSRWANFLKPAGMNPLLTYILPFIFYAAIDLSFLPSMFNEGWTGLIRSVVFSLFILGIAQLLTKWNIRLKL